MELSFALDCPDENDTHLESDTFVTFLCLRHQSVEFEMLFLDEDLKVFKCCFKVETDSEFLI